jgi:hypothetical protein
MEFSEQTAIIYTKEITGSVYVMETENVFVRHGTKLNNYYLNALKAPLSPILLYRNVHGFLDGINCYAKTNCRIICIRLKDTMSVRATLTPLIRRRCELDPVGI